jgi:nitrate reductase NapE component
VATGPWDPGSARFLASDADRERTVDILKTAFVHGSLTRDDLTLLTGRALTARTYAELAATTAGLTPPAAKPATRPPAKPATRPAAKPAARPPAKRRVSKKVAAWSACAVVLPPTLSVAFLSYYGGFLVMMAFTFIGAVLCSKPPAPPRPPLAKSIGGKH